MKKLLILIGLISSFSIFGNEIEGKNINLGLGVFYRNSLYRLKDHNEVLPFPFAGIQYGDFYYDLPIELGYNFYKTDDLKLSIYGRYNLYTGYKPKDMVREFKDMDRRKDDLHVGLKAKYKMGKFQTGLNGYVSGDVLGRSNGITTRVELNQPVPINEKVGILPYVAVKYMSDNYTDYYFGIKDSEASRGINKGKKYDVDGTFNFEVGFRGKIDVTEKFAIMFSAEYIRYGDNIGDSPLVRNRNVYGVGTGISYIFTY